MKFYEIEVKFYILDYMTIAKQINKTGAINVGKHFEKNITYENREGNLLKKKILLRLRNSEVSTLTIKKPVNFQNNEFKTNEELEVTVSNFTVMNDMLNILGYYKEKIYEKWRETWQLDETILCLDTMPYGNFLEIEGPPKKIRSISTILQLNWNKRIVASYLEMFEFIKKQESIIFDDLKFDAFKDKHFNFSKYRHFFEKFKRN